jgi:hypothetical protein
LFALAVKILPRLCFPSAPFSPWWLRILKAAVSRRIIPLISSAGGKIRLDVFRPDLRDLLTFSPIPFHTGKDTTIRRAESALRKKTQTQKDRDPQTEEKTQKKPAQEQMTKAAAGGGRVRVPAGSPWHEQ